MELKYETKKDEKSLVTLSITVPKEEVKKEFDKLIMEAQKKIAVPGFRKGKVPFSVIAMKYKDIFLEDTTNALIENAFKEVYEKLEEKPLGVSVPQLKEKKKVELDKDFIFELEYDVFPEISFGEYKGIEITKEELEVKDSDVDEIIEGILKDLASLEDKDGEVEQSDVVYINCKVYDGEELIDELTDYFIDTNLEPPIDKYKISDDIIGIKKGEEKTIIKEYEKDEPNKDIAGKKLKIVVEVTEIKSLKIPELTEEVIKKIDPDCKTKEELREKVRENLDNSAKEYTNKKMLEQILETLIESFKGNIPESMIESQNKAAFNELVGRFQTEESALYYLSRMKNIKTKQEYFELIRDESIKEIKRALIFDAIRQKENITVTEDEVKESLISMAKKLKMSEGDLMKTYKQMNYFESVKNEAEINKVSEYLIENANITKTTKISYNELKNKNKGETINV